MANIKTAVMALIFCFTVFMVSCATAPESSSESVYEGTIENQTIRVAYTAADEAAFSQAEKWDFEVMAMIQEKFGGENVRLLGGVGVDGERLRIIADSSPISATIRGGKYLCGYNIALEKGEATLTFTVQYRFYIKKSKKSLSQAEAEYQQLVESIINEQKTLFKELFE